MLAYVKRYGLGDAQIDAQNRAGDIMGRVVAQIDASRNAGTLSRNQIISALAEMQSAIDTYKAGYSHTDRGIAGGNTLQSLYYRIQSDLMREIQSLPDTAAPGQTFLPGGDLNETPIFKPYDPAFDYTINVSTGGTSPATAGNLQPSQTPGPPAGITAPENVPAPGWLQNPAVWIAAGLGLLWLIKKGGNS